MSTYHVTGHDFEAEVDVDDPIDTVTEVRILRHDAEHKGEQLVGTPYAESRPMRWSAWRSVLEQFGGRIEPGRIPRTGP